MSLEKEKNLILFFAKEANDENKSRNIAPLIEMPRVLSDKSFYTFDEPLRFNMALYLFEQGNCQRTGREFFDYF